MKFSWSRCAARMPHFALVWSLLAASQVQAQDATCNDPDSTMLWEVQGESLSERGITVFLFGSMHVGKSDFYPLPKPVEERFSAAEHVVFEVDPRAALDPAVAAELGRRSLLPPEQELGQLLSADTLASLRDVLTREALGDTVLRLKPWMIGLLLADVQARSSGFDPAWGIESYLMQRLPAGADVLELESMQQQLDMLEALDPEVFMSYSLRDYEHGAKQIESLAQAWRCGDHARLETVLFEDDMAEAEEPEDRAGLELLHEQLFTARNRVMAEGIEKLIDSGKDDYFVVVGAGHLLGEDSVVQLLRAEGYTVQPVRL